MGTRVAAILACHNRAAKTLACLQSLADQVGHDASVDVFLADDASTDGTADQVRHRFPDVRILDGDGTLFWSGGMRLAFATAMESDYDHYLWLNDDVVLDAHALGLLLDTHRALLRRGESAAIVVGSMRDPQTGELTYGGVTRASRWRPLKFDLVTPGTQPRESETLNGNAVLFPRAVVDRVGNIDDAYEHSMGDFDYGLRARRLGCSVWVAPGMVGRCAQNPPVVHGADPLGQELRDMRSLKGLPPRPWRTYARRWAGPLWPIYYLSPYARRATRSMRARSRNVLVPRVVRAAGGTRNK